MYRMNWDTVSFTALPIYHAFLSCKNQHYALTCQSCRLMSNYVIFQMSEFGGLNLFSHADEAKSFFLLKTAGKLKRQQTSWFREGYVSGDVKHYLGINTFIETAVFLHQHVSVQLFKGWSNPLLGEASLGVLRHTASVLYNFLEACRKSLTDSQYVWEG